MNQRFQHYGCGLSTRAATALVVVAAVIAGTAPAHAATYWWNAGNALWTANGSWAASADGTGSGSVPTSADTAIFSVTGSTAAVTGTLGADAAVYGIQTVPGQLGLTLTAATAKTLTIGAGGITSQGSSFVTAANGRIALADSQVWSGNFGNFVGNVSLASASNETLRISQFSTGTVTGTWSDGSGGGKLSLWVAGTGTTRFNIAPTFTGTLTLQEGVFTSAVASALSNPSKIQFAGGALQINNSTNANGVDVIGGSSILSNNSFNNSQTFTRAKGGGVFSRVGITVLLGSAGTVNGIIPWMSMGNSNNGNFAQLINGTISQAIPLVLSSTSAQKWNLNLASDPNGNYEFGTSGQTGSVTLTSNRTVNSLNVSGTSTANLDGFDLTMIAALTRQSTANLTVQGAGRLLIGSDGELVLRAWNGAVVISSTIGQSTAGGHLTVGSVNTTDTTTPTGSVTLSGNNQHSGGTSLHGLRLNINNAGALGTGTFTLSGGTLDNTSGDAIVNANNNAQVWNVNLQFAGSNPLDLGTGAVSLGNWAGSTRTVTVTSSTLTVGGAISSGSHSDIPTTGLDKAGAGTLVLGGANTYSGPTSVSAGQLFVNGNQSSATGAMTVASGATLGGNGTIGAALTTVNGLLTPGSSGANNGLLTASGSLTLGSTSLTQINITGTGVRGTAFDAVNVTNALAYSGTLSFLMPTIASGTFNIFDMGSSAGNLAAVSGTFGGSFFDFTGPSSGTWSATLTGGTTATFTQSTGELVIVPEPATLALAGLGIGLAGFAAWRRRHGRAA